VFAEVGRFYRIDSAIFASRGDGHVARAAAAWQDRKLTAATLHKLSTPLRLGPPESVSNLTRRFDREIKKDLQLPADLQKIEARIVRKTRPDANHQTAARSRPTFDAALPTACLQPLTAPFRAAKRGRKKDEVQYIGVGAKLTRSSRAFERELSARRANG